MRNWLLAGLVWFASGLAWGDWPQWRGPTGDNHAPTAASTPPIEWSNDEGTLWNVAIPGRGHSSPIVVGDRLYLTTCDEQARTRSLLIFDRHTGQLLASPVAHTGGLAERIHAHNTHASSTPASDGEHVYAMFDYENAIWITCYDLDGQQLWQRRVAGFDPQLMQFGLGTSPILHQDLLILATEYDGADSGVYAIDKRTGDLAWKAPRRQTLSNSSPIVATVGGKPQVVISGHASVAAYDVENGHELWKVGGAHQATCGTMVWDQSLDMVFASGGFPESKTLAIKVSDEPHVAWENPAKCYEQSMLVYEGHVYAVADSGVAFCWRAADGERMWTKRLGGKYSSSPLLAGDRIYVSNEGGTTFVIAASPREFEQLGQVQLGDEVFATPASVEGKLYYRYADSASGTRQEYLMAVGAETN